MRRILVTGADGQVGRELQCLQHAFPDLQLHLTSRSHLDITDERAVEHFFESAPFTDCINCAAYTAVDRAETEADQAAAVNIHGVRHLAAACAAHQTNLIHFSTDYVYHTRQNRPFIETDPTEPKSVYAKTKLAGEKEALNIHSETLVIRTSWVYSSFGKNFVKTMLKLGYDRKKLGIVFDQVGTPTYAFDLAQTALRILNQYGDTKIPGGIYHYSNEGVTSWYDFAKSIFELQNIACRVTPITTSEYPLPAPRPPYSVLNKNKIKNTFGLDIPYWKDSLKECLALLAK